MSRFRWSSFRTVDLHIQRHLMHRPWFAYAILVAFVLLLSSAPGLQRFARPKAPCSDLNCTSSARILLAEDVPTSWQNYRPPPPASGSYGAMLQGRNPAAGSGF
jgi:hypothetical protein